MMKPATLRTQALGRTWQLMKRWNCCLKDLLITRACLLFSEFSVRTDLKMGLFLSYFNTVI